MRPNTFGDFSCPRVHRLQRWWLHWKVTLGLEVNVPEKLAVVADGQGNPPEVVTFTVWLVETIVEGTPLVNGPETVPDPPLTALVVHVAPRTLAVAVRPSCGMIS